MRRPKIYIGTDRDRPLQRGCQTMGVIRQGALPSGRKESLPQGWKVTHRGLVAWCQRPSYQDIGSIRFFFLLLETLFGGLLYAMKSTTVNYGFPTLCPWPLQDLLYDGLCSHAAMFERHPASTIITEAKTLKEFRVLYSAQNKKSGNSFASCAG